MNNAKFIANYIIQFCNENNMEINNLKLQKYLYYIQARCLVELGESCFNDPIEKWQYGPVVPSVYHEFKRFVSSPIGANDIVRELKTVIRENGILRIENVIPYNRNAIQENIRNIIERTVRALDKYGVFELVGLTHKNKIWSDYEERINAGEYHLKYSNEEITNYFIQNEEEMIWRES